MRTGRPTRVLWATGVAVLGLAILAALAVFIAKQPYGYDLWAYVLAGRHLLASEPLYPAEPGPPYGPFGEYHYAPTVAVPFMLLAPLDFWLATALWIGLNTGIAAAIGVHLIRTLPADARPWAGAAYVLFLPLILELSLGNLNLLTLALCLLAWSQRERPVAAGSLLAIAIGIKLLPATLVLFYLAAGRVRLVAWTAAVGGAAAIATALVFPRELPQYLALLRSFAGSTWAADVIASTPPADVAALLLSPFGRAALPVAALATAIAGGLAARLRPRHEEHLHHLALAYAPYLAPFGLLWFPYLVTALPLMAITLRRTLALPRAASRAALLAALVCSWLLLQVIGARDDVVPIAAHLLGLLTLLALGAGVLFIAAPRTAARTAAHAAA